MSGKINSHTCLMLTVYKSFQTVKYGQQSSSSSYLFDIVYEKQRNQKNKRNHISQDLTGLEIKISMKASKTENRFSTTEIRFQKHRY